MLYIAALRRLEKPLFDLNITITGRFLSRPNPVAALPDGEAVITNYTRNNSTQQTLKINSHGKVTQVIYSCVNCSYIGGLLVLGDYLYIIHYNGTVIETRFSDGRILRISTIPDVISVTHTGSLSNKPDKIPDKQTLLLCDFNKGEVFTFKYSTGQKQVRVTGLGHPHSVSYFFHNHTVYYIACEDGRSRINVYNQTWDLIRTIGTKGSNDGELDNPSSAIVSDEDTIIISDLLNDRVSEFSFNGTFLRHLLVISDGINWPWPMSYYHPHLWLVHGHPHHKPYRYNLYRYLEFYHIELINE